jgi:predicted amidohydrolase
MSRHVTIAAFNMGFHNAGDFVGRYDHPSSIQFGPTLADNLAIFERLISQAGTRFGADFVCFSEHALKLGVEGSDTELAVAVPGPEVQRLAEAARQANCCVVMGLLEKVGQKPYNSAVVLGPEGSLVGTYRKVHLTPGEYLTRTPGTEWPVFTTPRARIGIQICYDYYFPETTRCLALGGAEIVFSPTMQDARGLEQVMALQRARAIDNGIYFVSSVTFTGGREPHSTTRSVIIDPVGVVRADSGFRDGWAVATVDLDDPFPQYWSGIPAPQRMRAMLFKSRRPETYGAIVAPKTSPSWREIILDGCDQGYPEI